MPPAASTIAMVALAVATHTATADTINLGAVVAAVQSAVSASAANATLGSPLAPLLTTKGQPVRCPLLEDAPGLATQAALVSDKLATLTSAQAPALCAALAAAPPDAQCALTGFIEKAATTCGAFPNSCPTPACSNPGGSQTPPPATAADGTPLPAQVPNRKPLPLFKFPDAVLQAEGATYNWWYRVIVNLAAYTACASRGAAWATPPGWTTVATATAPSNGLPVAVVMTDASTLAVVLRGTIAAADWDVNFDYAMVKPPPSVGTVPPGTAVHAGFATVYDAIAPTVMAAIDARVLGQGAAVTRVVVTGHSMGAAVGQILALAVANKLNAAGASTSTDAILFAPPNVGSPSFVAAFNTAVNGRRIVFEYDIVPQIPCKTQATCPAKKVRVATDGGPLPAYPYESVGGTVPLTVKADIPVQQQYWASLDHLNACNMLGFFDGEKKCGWWGGSVRTGALKKSHNFLSCPP